MSCPHRYEVDTGTYHLTTKATSRYLRVADELSDLVDPADHLDLRRCATKPSPGLVGEIKTTHRARAYAVITERYKSTQSGAFAAMTGIRRPNQTVVVRGKLSPATNL